MEFEWDEDKRQKNISERGLDMVYIAPMVFADENVAVVQDMRENYGQNN